MKRIIGVLITAVMAAGMLGGTAQADNPHPNVIVGTNGKDVLIGTSGDDAIFGLKGTDWLFGGKGHDTLYGGRARDQLRAADGMRDRLFGGPGLRDQCVGDTHDVFRGCEQITIIDVH